LGFGDKAYEYYKMINPIEHAKTKEEANKYKVEPYVIAADVYGNSNLVGRGGWTWYTGSASWYYIAGIEYILGLKIENKQIKIRPSIPTKWDGYEIKYKYKNTNYNIKVKKIKEKLEGQEQKIYINGKEEKEIILLENAGIVEIEVLI
jgi:cyclic beta-1,2-glucan synthetase